MPSYESGEMDKNKEFNEKLLRTVNMLPKYYIYQSIFCEQVNK